MKFLLRIIFVVLLVFFSFFTPNISLIEAESIIDFKQIFENHGSIMMLIDAESGAIEEVNQAAADFYGYSTEELKEMYIQDINTLSAEEVEKKRMAAVEKESNHFVFPHTMANGEIRVVEVYSYPYLHNNKILLFSIINDITVRKRIEQELAKQNERLKRAERTTKSGHWEFHFSENKVVYSEGAAKIYGIENEWTIDEIQQAPLPKYREMLDQALKDLINGVSEYDVQFQIERFDDGKIIDIRSIAEYDAENNIVFGVIHDISEFNKAKAILGKQKNLIIMGIIIFILIQFFIIIILIKNIKKRQDSEKEIKRISNQDKLTDLYNRSFADEKLKEIDRKGSVPVSLIMGDVNGLKLTNDTFGHNRGDELLKNVAIILKQSCRSEDIIARWGGDEFVVLLPQTKFKETEKIVKRIKQASKEASQNLTPVSISLGYAVKKYSFQNIYMVLQKAEDNMYKEKSVERIKVRHEIKENICRYLAENTDETEKLKYIDMLGRKVEVYKGVKKVVAVGPGTLRMITYLKAVDKIVGVEDFEKRDSKKPYILAYPELQKLPSIGPQFGGDAELIAAQKPDIIFYSFTTKKEAEVLQNKTGVPVFVINYGGPGSTEIETFFQGLKLMGKILNKEDRAEYLQNYYKIIIKDLEDRTNNIPGKDKIKVYTGGIGFKGAQGIASTEPAYPPFEYINTDNVAGSLGYEHAVISKEKLLEWDPDIIFVDEGGYSLVLNDLKRKEFSFLSAVINNKIYGVLPYNYYTTNFATVLANAYYMGKVVYPDNFQDIDPEIKADQIYKEFLDKGVYKEMEDIFGGYKKIEKEIIR